jgi:hypothetical protein
MLVGSKISYEFNKNLSAPEPQKTLSGISTPALLNNQQKDVFFGQENQPLQENKEPKKNPWSVKNITNWAGVILGITIIAVPMILRVRRSPSEKIVENLGNLSKKVKANSKVAEEKIAQLKDTTGKEGKEGPFFNLLHNLGKWNEEGELANNLIYGFGTVVVMPLVIMFSPFGKKDSTKEDKLYAVLRQPISFATMFSIQLTMDKLVKGLLPDFKKTNVLEDVEFDKDGKLVDSKNIDKVKYNEDVVKDHFIIGIKEKLNKTEEEAKKLADAVLKIAKDNKYSKPEEINKLVSEKLNIKDSQELMSRFNKTVEVISRYNALGEYSKILGNIFISAPIGCTLLNVIYGKFMKNFGPNSPRKQESAVKGGDK